MKNIIMVYQIIKKKVERETTDKIREFIKENKIVGMLLDLNMPNVDGFKVLEYFDQNNLFDRIPVAIITGVDSKDEISRTLMYPVVDVLSKPFNEKNVKTVIDKMLKND